MSKPSPKQLISKAEKFVVSKLCVFTLKDVSKVVKKVNKLITLMPKTAYVTFIRSVKFSTLIVPYKFYEKVYKALSEFIETFRCNLEAVVLHFPEEAYTTPGVLAKLFNHFRKQRINIYEIFTSYLDVMVVIDESDHERLKKVIG